MKVMVVAKHGRNGFAPFVQEQVDALRQRGVDVETFAVKGKGIGAYLHTIKPLKQRIKVIQPDIVHAHYGLCGLLCNLQRNVPVATTYHGSDINDRLILPLSKITIGLSAANIFVSEPLRRKAGSNQHAFVQPCGVDTSLFSPLDKTEAKQRLGITHNSPIVLFAGSSSNKVKNFPLAKAAVDGLNIEDINLIELNGYSRQEVALLMNAADVLLLTSHHEGSPQVIKEAMAVGCPIVSVDVGDVRQQIGDTDNCFVATSTSINELTTLLQRVLNNKQRTNGREKLINNGLSNDTVAQHLCNIYQHIIDDNHRH